MPNTTPDPLLTLLRSQLGARSTEWLLADAGYTMHGPGEAGDPDLQGRFWWVLGRPAWSGYETSPDSCESPAAAHESALKHLLADHDVDWRNGTITPDHEHEFSTDFKLLLCEVSERAKTHTAPGPV